jgi:histone H3/H4
VLKKMRNRTETIVITKIDTVIKVKIDTVPKIVRVAIHDTASLENTTSVARSYYDTVLNKLVLSLKGKVFDLPVTAGKITITKADIKSVDRKPNYLGWSFGIFLVILLIYLIYVIKTKILKYLP